MLKLWLRYWSKFVHAVTLETFLNDRANGGSVISLRTLCITGWVFLLVVGLNAGFGWGKSPDIQWFGTIFVAVYAGLYARFSSQWMYLAGVYNTIKQTEAQAMCDRPETKLVIADWKAGFMADSIELHLSRKPIFAGVISVWGDDPLVKKAFEYSNGESAYHELMTEVRAVWDRKGGKIDEPHQPRPKAA